jgi:hypothetical protein
MGKRKRNEEKRKREKEKERRGNYVKGKKKLLRLAVFEI